MSRPLWGKVAGVSLTEGGNSLSILDCPPTSPPIPITTVQLTRTKRARPYNPASEFPLSEPSRAHLSPKGEAYCMNHANKPHQTRKAIQPRKRVPPLRSPHGCHLSPKGEALVYAVGVCTTVLSLLASIIGSRNL